MTNSKQNKTIECNSPEEMEQKMKETFIKKGNPLNQDHLKIKWIIKDKIFYYEDSGDRIYPTKPEWAERALHDCAVDAIKLYLKGHYDQPTLDLLNHLLYVKDPMESNNLYENKK